MQKYKLLYVFGKLNEWAIFWDVFIQFFGTYTCMYEYIINKTIIRTQPSTWAGIYPPWRLEKSSPRSISNVTGHWPVSFSKSNQALVSFPRVIPIPWILQEMRTNWNQVANTLFYVCLHHTKHNATNRKQKDRKTDCNQLCICAFFLNVDMCVCLCVWVFLSYSFNNDHHWDCVTLIF